MIFASRRAKHGPDPSLQARVRIFLVGAVLAMAGIGLDSSLLVGLAIVVLSGGLVLGLFRGKAPSEDEDVSEEGPPREDEGPG